MAVLRGVMVNISHRFHTYLAYDITMLTRISTLLIKKIKNKYIGHIHWICNNCNSQHTCYYLSWWTKCVCVCVCFASLSVISRACCIIVLLTLMHHAIATRHAYSNQLHSPNTGPIIPGFILLMLSVRPCTQSSYCKKEFKYVPTVYVSRRWCLECPSVRSETADNVKDDSISET